MTVLCQRSGYLTVLIAQQSAQAPGPDRDFLDQKLLKKIRRLVVIMNAGIEVLVFARIFLSIGVSDQQPFRKESMLQSILCDCSFSSWCSWPNRLGSIPAVGFDLFR